MSFLNPLLLLGALGIALPIVAHLLNRFEVRQTDWAAMQFLNRNVRVRSRNIKLRDLLLLLLRCLALLLLVMAFARPSLRDRSLSWLPGESRVGAVIALDVSFSMEHGGENETRFERALEQVRLIGERMQKGDPCTLVLLNDGHQVVLRNIAFDLERFQQALDDLKPSSGSLDIGAIPKTLSQLVEDMEASHKEVYLITDGQSTDWNQPSRQLRDGLADLGSVAEVFLVTVAGSSANLAVTSLELVSGVLRKGTTARYRATVCNYGEEPVSNVIVQGRVDGVQFDTKQIPLIAAGTSESVSLFVPFLNAGTVGITAEVSGDSLATDNIRRTVAAVRDRVSVLCVDGSSGDAGRLVVSALLARADGAQGENYSVRSVPWLSFPAEKLEEVDVIVFTDVPKITAEQVDQLSAFVREGNGFVWFAGENTKASAWNEQSASGESALLPARLGTLIDTSNALGAGKPLDPEMPDHNICLPLLSLPEDLLNETRFLRQFEVEPRTSSFPLLKLAGSGTPVLLEQSLGRGHVFMFTTTAETAWNNMALTPVFPMVMQQIVTYLVGREFERPRIVGDSLTLRYQEQPDANDAIFDAPSGESFTVPVTRHDGQYVALLEGAREAGYYLAKVSVQAPGQTISVNVDARESEVACLSKARLSESLEGLGLNISTSEDELTAAIDSTRTGRSAWRFFMLAALAFLLLECLFADRLLSRGKTNLERTSISEPQNV